MMFQPLPASNQLNHTEQEVLLTEEVKSPYLALPSDGSTHRFSQRSAGSNGGDGDQSGSKLSDWS